MSSLVQEESEKKGNANQFGFKEKLLKKVYENENQIRSFQCLNCPTKAIISNENEE